jgi:hypothetical protein
MKGLERAAVEDGLEAGYQNVTAVADRLADAELMLPSRCAGWTVGDVLYHQLLDARPHLPIPLRWPWCGESWTGCSGPRCRAAGTTAPTP